MIHDSVLIERGATIGCNVNIDAFTIVRSNVVLGDNASIGSHCDIGIGDHGALLIGRDSTIRSHSAIYSGSTLGDRLETGHRVTIRERTKAGINLRVGTLSDIQGDCQIGNYVRLHSNVHIGKHTNIHDFAWFFPYVVTTNDPHPPSNIQFGVTVGEHAVVATMSTLLPGVKMAKHSILGANSRLGIDTEEGFLYSGNPAKKKYVSLNE